MSAEHSHEAVNSSGCNQTSFNYVCTHQLYHAVEGDARSGANYGLMASYYCSFVIAPIAIAMSSTMLFVIARLLRKRNAFLLLAANLCVADVSVACFTIVQHTFSYLRHRPTGQQINCVTTQSTPSFLKERHCAESIAAQLWDVSTNENLFTILLMTLSHLVSLKWPHHSKKVLSHGGLLIAITLSWLVSVSLGFTKLLVVMTTDIGHDAAVHNYSSFLSSYCARVRHYNQHKQLHEKHMEILYSVSVAIILIVYISIFIIYVYIFRRVWARMLHKNRGKHEGFLIRVRLMRRTLVTTLFLLGSFSMLWLPIVVYSALRSINFLMPHTLGRENFETLRVALATLVCVSGIIDPLLYGLRVLDIRNAIKRRLQPMKISASCFTPRAGRHIQMHETAMSV